MECRVYTLGDAMQAVSEVGRVASCSIERSATDDVCLLESASIELDGFDASWDGGWHRIEAVDGGRGALGCFRFEVKSRTYSHGRVTAQADGYSLLKPADEAEVAAGFSAKAGDSVASIARSLLSACPCGVDVPYTTTVPKDVVFDSGCTRLDALWQVLDAVGWCVQLVDGVAVVSPLPDEPALSLDATTPHVMRDGYEAGEELTYERELDGDVRPFDMVAVELPQVGMSGRYRVLSQSIDIGSGVTVSETVGDLDRGSE